MSQESGVRNQEQEDKNHYSLIILHNSRKSYGFTFIELLVVITIMGLLIALGVASYNNFNDRQTLVTTVEKIQTDLRLAQARAVANKAPISGCTAPFEGYRAEFTSGSYSISASCAGTNVDTITVNFPSSLTKTGGSQSILFKPRFQGTDLAVNNLTLDFSYTVGAGATASLTITPQGEIRTSL